MSAQIDDGGPAFPETPLSGGHPGMTLRDWFAGQALAGALASQHHRGSMEANARDCYAYADAMIAAGKESL